MTMLTANNTNLQDIGDNKEVIISVPGADVDVVFNFNSTLTSASDTNTIKYFDNISRCISRFVLRSPTADCKIKAANGINYTDSISVGSADSFTNTAITPLKSLTITCSTNNTQLNLFVE